jgi:DNA-binding beta-propeller fold protein YncE
MERAHQIATAATVAAVDVPRTNVSLPQGPELPGEVAAPGPAKLAGTVTGAKQPSGLSFSPSGDLALVANRADKSITVLSIKGTEVKVIDTIAMGDEVSQVVFTQEWA